MEASEGKGKKLLSSFVGGIALTLLLLVIVPILCTEFIEPIITDTVGETSFLWLSSSLIVTLIMWIILILFMVVLGGGVIVRKFGILGVVGLIAAYWALGRLEDAIIPVLTIVLYVCYSSYRKKMKERKAIEEK